MLKIFVEKNNERRKLLAYHAIVYVLGLKCGAQKFKKAGLSAFFYQVPEKKVIVVVESASV